MQTAKGKLPAENKNIRQHQATHGEHLGTLGNIWEHWGTLGNIGEQQSEKKQNQYLLQAEKGYNSSLVMKFKMAFKQIL